jgi:hypothetical protein
VPVAFDLRHRKSKIVGVFQNKQQLEKGLMVKGILKNGEGEGRHEKNK